MTTASSAPCQDPSAAPRTPPTPATPAAPGSASAVSTGTSARRDDSSAAARRLVFVALVLTGLSMRTAVTSVGAVLDDLERGLHVGSGVAGIITTLPVVVFAVLGTLTPRVAHHVGQHRLLVAALVLMTIGLVARAFAGSVWVFAAISVVTLCGGAASNVLMPSLVKRHFPDHLGPLTATYTTALAIGATAGAGLTVPIGELGGSAADHWRFGLGSWAVFAALAVVPWLPSLRHDRPEAGPGTVAVDIAALRRSPTAWAMALFFGGQSVQAYVSFGWYSTFFRDHGASASHAGLLVAFYSALSIPISMFIPILAIRGQRLLIVVLAVMYAVAYTGMLVAPLSGAWVWMLLAGVASGMFPVALTMVALRTRTPEVTAALSAFMQGIGYVIAGTGPLLVGLVLAITDNWGVAFVVLFAGLALAIGAGWRASRPCYVEDELAA